MKYIYESGRSMVEMLGTLAIMGVLAVGGIMGYKYGMDKYRAHETINELTVRAMGLMSQVNRAEIVELNMEMGNTTKFGYFVDAWIGEVNTDYFYISLEQVPPAICRHMLKIHWERPTAVYVGDYEYYGNNEYICGEDTYAPPMDFEFYRDFAEGTEYAEETYYESNSYSDIVSTNPTQSVCEDATTPLGDVWGSCYACDYAYGVQVGTEGKCTELCGGRILNSEGYCVLPCATETPLMNASGSCYACDITSNIYVGVGGQCSEVCSDRVLTEGGYCSLGCSGDTPLMNKYGNCYACTYSANVGVGTNGQCSEVCGNRVKDGELCRLACGEGEYADKPLISSNGECYSCSHETSVYVGKGGACYETCPNRYEEGGYCKLACGQNEYGDTPLMASNGACYSCDTTENVNVGSNGKCTEICANRELISNGVCALSKKCGVGEYADKPLQATNGTCYACDTTEKVYVSTRGKCEAVCQNRQLSTGGYCALACGEGDYADKPAMKSDGTCVECVNNSDCDTGELCLSKNNSNSSAYYEVCKPYELVYYDGFAQVKVEDKIAVSWWDSKKVCEDNGYSLVSGYELFDGWKKCVGDIASCGGPKTDLFNNLRKITGAWIWVKEPWGGNAWHIYLYNGNSSHYPRRDTSYTNAFCKTK